MPYTKVNEALSGVAELAKAIAVPHEHKPQRIPTYPSLERTAVLHLQNNTTYNVPANTTADMMLFRSPTYPLWGVWQPNNGNAGVYVNWSYTTLEFYPETRSIDLPPGPVVGPVGTGTGGAWATVTPIGMSDDHLPYIYLPAGVNVAANLSSPVGTFTNWEMDLEVYAGSSTAAGDLVERTSVTISGLGVTGAGVSFTFAMWARPKTLRFSAAPTVSGNIQGVSLGFFGTGSLAVPTGPIQPSLLPLFRVPEYSSSLVPYSDVRCTAAAVSSSNVTAVLSKEGTVQAGRVNVAQGYPFNPSNSFDAINRLHPLDRYFGMLEKGLYAFTLPCAETDVFRDHVVASTSVATPPPLFRLDGIGYYTHIRFSDLNTSSSTNLAITLDYHLEFRSSSMLFPLSFSRSTLEAYHECQMALVNMGTFYENPKHLVDITKKVTMSLPRRPRVMTVPAAKQQSQPNRAKQTGGKPKQNKPKNKKAGKGKKK